MIEVKIEFMGLTDLQDIDAEELKKFLIKLARRQNNDIHKLKLKIELDSIEELEGFDAEELKKVLIDEAKEQKEQEYIAKIKDELYETYKDSLAAFHKKYPKIKIIQCDLKFKKGKL